MPSSSTPSTYADSARNQPTAPPGLSSPPGQQQDQHRNQHTLSSDPNVKESCGGGQREDPGLKAGSVRQQNSITSNNRHFSPLRNEIPLTPPRTLPRPLKLSSTSDNIDQADDQNTTPSGGELLVSADDDDGFEDVMTPTRKNPGSRRGGSSFLQRLLDGKERDDGEERERTLSEEEDQHLLNSRLSTRRDRISSSSMPNVFSFVNFHQPPGDDGHPTSLDRTNHGLGITGPFNQDIFGPLHQQHISGSRTSILSSQRQQGPPFRRTSESLSSSFLPATPPASPEHKLSSSKTSRTDLAHQKSTPGVNNSASHFLTPPFSSPTLQPFHDAKTGGGVGLGVSNVGVVSVDESRYLLVCDVPDVEVGLLKEVFGTFGDVRAVLVKFLSTHGAVILAYFDIRHAIAASRGLQKKPIQSLGGAKLSCSFVSKQTVEQLAGDSKQGMLLVEENDGSIMVTMSDPQRGNLSLLGLQATLGSFGSLRSFRVVGTRSRAFLAEFFDTRAATDARTTLHSRKIEDTLLHVTFYDVPSTPCVDSPLSPSKRKDYEALYSHLSVVVSEQPKQQQQDELNGAAPGKGGPFDKAFLGRRGSTTSSFISSPSSILSKYRPTLPTGRSALVAEVEEDEPSSPTQLRSYHNAARRSSDFVGFVKRDQPRSSGNVWESPMGQTLRPSLSASTLTTPEHSAYLTNRQGPIQNAPIQNDFQLSSFVPSIPSINVGWPTYTLPQQQQLHSPPQLPYQFGRPSRSATSKFDGVPAANRLDLERIARGLDMRTTVMIKDIPNKLSRNGLLAILDSVPVHYDFVYLRFDFAQHVNVGYAFLNCTSPQDLLAFAIAKLGTSWNIFNSSKELQLVYANIQGKDALVQKFRNSAVLLQEDAYQPVIFYSNGPLRGAREPFPPPTDQRRRETSVRSTNQVGLYHHPMPSTSAPPLFGVSTRSGQYA